MTVRWPGLFSNGLARINGSFDGNLLVKSANGSNGVSGSLTIHYDDDSYNFDFSKEL